MSRPLRTADLAPATLGASKGSGGFWDHIRAPLTRRRAFRVCLIVGTVLVLLNHGDKILAGQFPVWWKVLLTYLVPYSVSSYSTAMLLSRIAGRVD